MTPTAPTDAFRILLVDDEPKLLGVVSESLTEFGDNVIIRYAEDEAAAADLLSEHFFDLAMLDVYGKDAHRKDVLVGTKVYRRIDDADLSTRVMLMTKFQLDEDAVLLLKLTGEHSAWRLAGFLDKTSNFGPTVKIRVGEVISQFLALRAGVTGLDQLAADISRQRYRYRDADNNVNLRKARSEIAAEVDRLLRKLYVSLPTPAITRESRVIVDLSPMGRRGLSAAVVVNANVRVEFASVPTSSSGHRTVLKVGPKRDILEEAARFHEYVRYGVELSHRVELLGVTGADALGGLIYSFAGGSYKRDLVALDEVLVEDLSTGDLDISTQALSSLFARKDWYTTPCGDTDVGEYFTANFRTDLPRSCKEGVKQLAELSKSWTQWPKVTKGEARSGISVLLGGPDGREMAVPDQSVLGLALLANRVPGCLVHGDMHGGNVMLECSRGAGDRRIYERSCLIDFRNAGPGPRCIDAVCLESSIRLADAEVLTAAHLKSGGDPTPVEQRALVEQVFEVYDAELALYRSIFLGEGEIPDEGWARQCALVLRSMRDCFDDVTLREYLTASVRYALRSLGFRLPPVARLRVLAWLAAQYNLVTNLAGHVNPHQSHSRLLDGFGGGFRCPTRLRDRQQELTAG